MISDLRDDYGLRGLNRTLTGHCNRKATMNSLTESDLPFHNWMIRVGFDLRNLHTLFDYVYKNRRR